MAKLTEFRWQAALPGRIRLLDGRAVSASNLAGAEAGASPRLRLRARVDRRNLLLFPLPICESQANFSRMKSALAPSLLAQQGQRMSGQGALRWNPGS
jgi:hypothetical protein